LPYDVIIVDEASMIDAPLFARLLSAVSPDARLILLGDNNQLASVEAGSVLGDICKAAGKLNRFTTAQAEFLNAFISDARCQLAPEYITSHGVALSGRVIELQRSRRFTGTGGIGKLSRALLRNDTSELKKIISEGHTPEYVIDTTGNAQIFESFISGYEAFIREPDIVLALEKLNQLRVLVTVREGDLGLNAINKKIENFLKSRKLIRTGPEYYENRPVLVTRNNPLLGLVNGDVGIVRMDAEKQLRVFFPDSDKGVRAVVPEQLTHVQTLWAMTIHKSQGSEYGQVLVVLPDDVENKLLTRELLYTAITRARTRVVIQGKEEIVLAAAATEVKRASGIVDRFNQDQSQNAKR
jgi:exodeoxyribonuclease V alpha subunit